MSHYLFLDESGTSSLKSVNLEFPYFLLCGVIIDIAEYQKICLAINSLKERFFGTTNIILHSSDIRKLNGPFKIFFDTTIKYQFYEALNTIINEHKFHIISCCIKTDAYIQQYGKTTDSAYQVCLNFILERAYQRISQSLHQQISIIAESRGSKEDHILKEFYQTIVNRGTGSIGSALLQSSLTSFRSSLKYDNEIGIQLADLCAYPLVSHIRFPSDTNLSYNILPSKLYPVGKENIKIFP